MSNLSDLIEQYLRRILIEQEMVELKRRELAKMFRCAPSQINYVLTTRFTLEQGYLIESKRGGGGYIRILQVKWRVKEDYPQIIKKLIPEQIIAADVEKILDLLVKREFISLEKSMLVLSLLNKEFEGFPPEISDSLRAKFLKTLLLVLGSKNNIE